MIRILLVLAAVACCAAAPAQTPGITATATKPGIAVRDDGLVGTWYPPAGGKRGPAVLVLGGSEGGEDGARRVATALAAHDYGAFAIAYFKAPGLPGSLQNIPLEYFDRATAWLARQPLADPQRLGLYGASIGGETALVVATRRPEFKGIVAVVPSSVVWQGFDPADYRSVAPTYTLAGQPVPYLPYDTNGAFTGIHDLYARSLKTVAAHPDAVIPVERIAGAVLLLSAREDALWPSTPMSEAVMARLDAAKFKPLHRHIAYPDAGHGAPIPPGAGAPQSESARDNAGGTPAGNAAARVAAWRETLGFLAATIGTPK